MRFKILGPVEVHVGGQPRQLGGRQQRLLLSALLVRANQVVTLDQLVDALWGGDPPRSARGRVHTAVHQLRRVLGEDTALTWVQPGFVLRVDAGASDAAEFDSLCERGRQALASGDPGRAAELLRQALALWRGPAFGDLADRMPAVAAGLEERRLSAVEARIDADLRLGRHDELVAELRELVAQHPLRERLHECLMLALYRCGRRGEALSAYTRARQVLHDELGVEPGVGLRHLHQAVLTNSVVPLPGSADPPAPSVAPPDAPATIRPPAVHQLPATVADFTGRETELKETFAAVQELIGGDTTDRFGVVAVVGLAGVGKSAFAVQLAHHLAPMFPGGQLFLNLQGFSGQPLTPIDALDRLCGALGAAPDAADLASQQQAYAAQLAGRRMLVVLDNARDTDQVRPLLAAAPGCLTLLTSRQQLPGLDGLRTVVLDVLPPDEGRRLLAAIIGERRAHPDDADRIVALCDGLPLAVRIAGARLAARPNWSLAHFAERLAHEQARLTELAVGGSTVRRAFTLSYRALSPTARQVFRRLGLFPGPEVDIDTAACLAGLPVDHVAPLMESLADASLLQSTEWLDRYRLHDLLRLFAGELAAAEDAASARTAALKRTLAWYLHTAYAAADLIRPYRTRPSVSWCRPPHPPREFASQPAAMAWCEAERVNVLGLVNAAAAHGLHRYAGQLPVTMNAFYNHRRHWADWLTTHHVAVDSADAIGDLEVLSIAHTGLGSAYFDLARAEQACYHLERGLAIRRQLGDEAGVASSLNNLGGVYQMLGEHDRAIECLREALVIRRRLNDRAGIGMTLCNLGDVYHAAQRHVEAIDSLEQALPINEEVSNRLGQAACLVNLADVLLDVGRYDDAEPSLDRAAVLFEELENNYGLGMVLHNRGRLMIGRGAPDQAIMLMREALDLRTRIGDSAGQGGTLEQLGIAYSAIGDTVAARQAWQQSYDLLSGLDGPGADRVRARLSAATPRLNPMPHASPGLAVDPR